MSTSTALRPTQWSGTSKFLHWLMVLMLFVIAVIGLTHDYFPGDLRKLIMGWHKALGITVLVLAAARLVWNLFTPSPARIMSTPNWQHLTAQITHGLLYVLMLAMPLSGWIMSSAGGRPVNYFGLGELPNLVAKNPALRELSSEWHETMFWVLLAVVIVHAGAAIYHQMVLKDGLLDRMHPRRR